MALHKARTHKEVQGYCRKRLARATISINSPQCKVLAITIHSLWQLTLETTNKLRGKISYVHMEYGARKRDHTNIRQISKHISWKIYTYLFLHYEYSLQTRCGKKSLPPQENELPFLEHLIWVNLLPQNT